MFPRPPKEAEDIVLVAIDEYSRREINPKWPWPRSITAELIRKINSYSPKVLALDLVFTGKSQNPQDDEALLFGYIGW